MYRIIVKPFAESPFLSQVYESLFQRAENLTSNDDAIDNERQNVIIAWKENNYPKSFLHGCLKRLALIDCNSSEGLSL